MEMSLQVHKIPCLFSLIWSICHPALGDQSLLQLLGNWEVPNHDTRVEKQSQFTVKPTVLKPSSQNVAALFMDYLPSRAFGRLY